MKKMIFATALAGSLFGLAAGTAGQAVATPSEAGSAPDTVNSQVNKVGTTPLELCTVESALPNRRADLRPNRMVLEPVYLITNC